MSPRTVYIILLVVSINVMAAGDRCETYDEVKHFGTWIDADGDGQYTRDEVLIEESMVPVEYTDPSQKNVRRGAWMCFFTNKTFVNAEDMDVALIVPLKEAYLSGAWRWDKFTRQRYANYMISKSHLLAVSKKAKKARKQKDISKWSPKNKSAKIAYAIMWVKVKNEFRLTSDSKELKALNKILKDYGDIVLPKEAQEADCNR